MQNYSIAQLSRLKNTVPFSEKLNNFISEWYENNKDIFIFTEVDNFNPEDISATFEAHKKTFNTTGKIHIWTGCSEGTIFGSEEINHKFRAWHDFTHIKNNLGYSQTEEAIVSDIQKNELPKNWIFEKDLIHAEIVGQAHFNFLNNSFLNNQRKFTIEYFFSPFAALKNKSYITM